MASTNVGTNLMQITVYGDSISGNCLKVKYAADYLNTDYVWSEVDILNDTCREAEFLKINPQGQVPAIVLPNGETIAQSNAILRWLAHQTPLLPADRTAQAKIDEWLFWEQYSHEPYIAVCRFQMRYLNRARSELEDWRVARGKAALDFMDQHLKENHWLAGPSFTIADIALMAYTRMSHEGGFSLAQRSNIKRWLFDCETELAIEPYSES